MGSGKLFFRVKVTVIKKRASGLAFLESQHKRTALITSHWRHAEGGARPLPQGRDQMAKQAPTGSKVLLLWDRCDRHH